MANTLRGRVFQVRPAQTIATKSGSTFVKRELILDCTRYDSITGERGFDNFPCVTFTQSNASLLDPYAPGDIVEVSIDITGRKSENSDAYYNDIRGYRIERLRVPQQPIPQEAPAPGVAAPAPQQYAPQQQHAPQPQAGYAPQAAAPVPPANDGLPF